MGTFGAASVTCLVKHMRRLLLGIHGIWQQAGQWACILLQAPPFNAAHAENSVTCLVATSLLTEDLVVGVQQTHHCLQTPFDIVIVRVLVLENWQSEVFITAACNHCRLWSCCRCCCRCCCCCCCCRQSRLIAGAPRAAASERKWGMTNPD